MALASEKRMKSWYEDENNATYKHFDYIFKNPCWDLSEKKPGGFSACPYFWIAWLIGFVLMRFFIVPPLTVIQLLSKAGFSSIIKPLDRLGEKIASKGEPMPSGLGSFALAFLIAVVGGVSRLIQLFWNYSMEHGQGEMQYIAFFGILSMLAVGIPHFIYQSKHKYEPNRCKTQYWVYLFALIILGISAVVCGPELVMSLKIIGSLIAIPFVGVFNGIVWLLAVIAGWIASAFWFVLASLTAVYFGFPAWALMLAFMAVCFGFSYMAPEALVEEVEEPSVTEEDWLNVLFPYFYWGNQSGFQIYKLAKYLGKEEEEEVTKAELAAFRIYDRAAMRKYMERADWSNFYLGTYDQYSALHKIRMAPKSDMKDLEKRASKLSKSYGDIYYCLEESIRSICYDTMFRSFRFEYVYDDEGDVERTIDYLENSYDEVFTPEVIEKVKLAAVSQQKEIDSAKDTLCYKMTQLFATLCVPIAAMGNGLLNLCEMIWEGICNVFTYVWMLIKSKKQGVCPYYTFKKKPVSEFDNDDDDDDDEFDDEFDDEDDDDDDDEFDEDDDDDDGGVDLAEEAVDEIVGEEDVHRASDELNETMKELEKAAKEWKPEKEIELKEPAYESPSVSVQADGSSNRSYSAPSYDSGSSYDSGGSSDSGSSDD
jgi:hypothetical protein